ncbi:Nif3-like dinuclear metal center hexameric protein [[Mycoplasma] gypis]|uniref:GTP cyclohydrolase 1 type 2 homolog n=1 Tax=[Mycoplasma] gypis TaxID=92404 RepID=A0ABZ2RSV3_9BACT|nr:Nif3-like dinuclear metal center hexameric protein [[Mycoplasma] gypis]
MLIKEFIKNLQSDIDLSKAEPWDPVGFSIPLRGLKKLKNVLVCLDITQKVVDEAITKNVNLIISHHPFIFYGKDKDFELTPYKQKLYEQLKKYKINTFSFHTAFDKSNFFSAKGIAQMLGFKPTNEDQQLSEFALKCDFKKQAIGNIFNLLRMNGIKNLQTNIIDTQKQVSNAIIFPGSGYFGELIKLKNETDFFITSDAKWSDLVAYSEEKVSVINVSHSLEKGFIYSMQKICEKYLDKNNLYIVWPEDLIWNID